MVSVIIPVYNGQRTIRRCLDSVFSQTYKDIEIVVINDGSTDNSKKIIEEMLHNTKRAVIIRKENNEGIEKARHAGIAASRGRLITFIDQDDYIDRCAIEIMVNALDLYDADLVQCQTDSFLTVFNRFIISLNHFTRNRRTGRLIEKKEIEREMLSFFGYGNFSVTVWAKLYKKELLKDISLGGLLYSDDLYLNMQVFPKLNRISLIPDVLYHYERQGTTSRYLPLWMEESKHLYKIKSSIAKQKGIDNAFLFSTIELRNCLKSQVESMILHKVDSPDGIKQWIKQELQDNTYNVFDWLGKHTESNKSPIAKAIVNKDIEAIYELCRKSVYEWKWKKIIRRLLIKYLG